MTKLRVAIETIGCRANQADSANLVELLDENRVEVVADATQADVVIVNSCCVTEQAERDCRKTARRALLGPRSPQVWLIGCAANALADLSSRVQGAQVLRFEQALPEVLADRLHKLAPEPSTLAQPRVQTMAATRRLGRARPMLKIQSGCSHHCAYCIVPTARGPERSVPIDEVLARAQRLVDEGFSEIVLTGVQLGAWGVDLPQRPLLSDLLPRLLQVVSPGRLRLSSIEPWHFGTQLVEAATSHPRMCSHYHLPLQSGDDAVLAAMGRGYTIAQYEAVLLAIRKHRPDAALGTDVLVGLPGEDQASFEKTVALLERLRPTHIHGFSYSPRKGTRAAVMPGRPDREVAKRRVKIIRQLGERLQRDFTMSQIGAEREIIVEDIIADTARGLTDNFLPVELSAQGAQIGELVFVKLEEILPSGRIRATPRTK
ncbi:MAG: MiaB/RimO family radical SAM methylthiotransferase [Myxococcota bacterium]|jgi:threonylcarbamoyladenosine tRNA methylthiotransferase MtaB|nr:MiaB/RimO family radical SAM methylthiotransferase [Myxococcota bacterium]